MKFIPFYSPFLELLVYKEYIGLAEEVYGWGGVDVVTSLYEKMQITCNN